MAPPGQPGTSQVEPRPELRDVSRVLISTDVAASLWPAVAAAAFKISPVVAAPLGPAVAQVAKVPGVDSVRDGGSVLPGPGLRDDL